MGQKNGECGTVSQERAFNGGIVVVAVPVPSIEKLLNDSVMFLVVITEIELAGNNIILYSNHRFKGIGMCPYAVRFPL